MFRNKAIIGAAEFGSDKITVLLGESLPDGGLTVIGSGEAPSKGIVKGEIDNADMVFDQLSLALNDADKMSGGELVNCVMFAVPVSGCDIRSQPGSGAVTIGNADGRVTNDDKVHAYNIARACRLDSGRTILNSCESFFVIDGALRRRNPIGQSACKLEARIHLVHGVANRMENFRQQLNSSGFDGPVELVFSPLAAAEGILAKEERENGVLLIDIGSGVTDYVLEFNSGVLASGQIPLGMLHLVNDWALGLDLRTDFCQKLLTDGTLEEAMRGQREFLEVPAAGGKIRRIPLSSFETIADLRLREMLEIVRSSMEPDTLDLINSGTVVTGGGALFSPVLQTVREVFPGTVRVGCPADLAGSVTGLDNPRKGAVWGALRYADFYFRCYAGGDSTLGQKMRDAGDSVKRFFRGIRGNMRDSFKF